MFHDGFLIYDVGFSILKFCIFWIFGFWILEFWILCIKIPYPLCGLPQGLFFLENDNNLYILWYMLEYHLSYAVRPNGEFIFMLRTILYTTGIRPHGHFGSSHRWDLFLEVARSTTGRLTDPDWDRPACRLQVQVGEWLTLRRLQLLCELKHRDQWQRIWVITKIARYAHCAPLTW